MPRKIPLKRERDDVPLSNATPVSNDQQAGGGVAVPGGATKGSHSTGSLLASVSVTNINQQLLEIALVRSEGALERWRRQTDKAKYQPHHMMAALCGGTHGGSCASSDDDMSGVVEGALRGALQHVGTIEVIFNDGAEALLVEHAEAVTAALVVPSADTDAEASTGRTDGGTVPMWFVGDVILFEASMGSSDAREVAACGGAKRQAATWVGYNLAAIKDPVDRVDAALNVVHAVLWPLVLNFFSAKPGIAQLTAFMEDSASWTRLLHVADGTLLPDLTGALVDKARRPTASDAASPSVAQLEGHLHALGYLTASALLSLHDGCIGMHYAVTRLTYEFIASPLFLQLIMSELDEAAQSNMLVHVAGVNASNDGGASRVNEVAATLQLFAECVWVPHAARSCCGAEMHQLWAHAAEALAAVMHMVIRRASDAAVEQPHQPSTSLNAARLAKSRGFQVAADLFVAWVQSTSARGSAFVPGGHNRGGPNGGGLLDAFLTAPAGWTQWVSWDERSVGNHSITSMRQLPSLGEGQHTSNMPPQILMSPTAIFQDASLARLCTMRRVYSQLYTPLAKALRCVFAEQGARRHDDTYSALRYAVVAIDTEQPLLLDNVATMNGSGAPPQPGDVTTAWRWARHRVAVSAFTQAPCIAVPIADQQQCRPMRSTLFGVAPTASDMWAHVVALFFTSATPARATSSPATEVGGATDRSGSSPVDSVLACVVVEMNEASEPFAFPCLCHHQQPETDNHHHHHHTTDRHHYHNTLKVSFLNGNTDAVCALLQAVGDARRVLRDDASSDRYPRASIVFADEMPATDDAVVAAQCSALAKLRYLHHLVMADEQNEIMDAARFGGTNPQPSTSASTAAPAGAQAPSPSLFAACCGSVKATGQLPLASARRAASQLERDAMRQASKYLPEVLSATVPDVLRGGGITECLGNAVVSGVSGLHTLEGVVGSGKSIAALLVAAVHGVGRRESREEFRQHQTSVLEHISHKAISTAVAISKDFSAKDRFALESTAATSAPRNHHPQSHDVVEARRSALRDLIRVRHQQLEEFNRCRQGFLVRNPVGIVENVVTSCSSMGLLGLLRRQHEAAEEGAEEQNGSSVAPPRHGWLPSIRDSGAARVARSPYVQRLKAKALALMASKRHLLALDAQMQHTDDGAVVLSGAMSRLLLRHQDAHRADRLYPVAMGILFRCHSDRMLPLSCNGTTLDEALRAAFGTHRVLLRVPDMACTDPQQDGGNDDVPLDAVPIPQFYKASSTTKGLFERIVATADSGGATQRGNSGGVWATGAHNHHNLMELQRQLVRAALHRIEQQLLWLDVLRDEASDFVAAFEASQLHDVLVVNEASCVESLPLLRGQIGPRTFRGGLELSGLIVDGLDTLRDDPLHILPTSPYMFISMSLERVASLDAPLSWGGGAAMAEHLRLRMLQLACGGSGGSVMTAPSSGGSASTAGAATAYTTSSSRLSECIRLLNAEVTSASTMLLPHAVLANRSTVTAATVHLNARRQCSVPFWRRNAALWCPSVVSDNSNGADALSDGFDPSSTTATAVVAAVLPTRVATEVYLACLLALEMQRYRCHQQSGANGEGGATTSGQQHRHRLLTVAVVVPSIAMVDVQVAFEAFHRAEDGDRYNTVLMGDLTTLSGLCFDMIVIAPCTAANAGRHVGSSDMWLWRVATRARRGFVVVTSHHSTTIAASTIASRPVDATLMLFRKYLADALTVVKVGEGNGGVPQVGTPEHRDAQLDVATLRRKNPFDTVRFHCPDHHVASKIMIARSMQRRGHRDGNVGDSEEVLQLIRDGAEECHAICMQRFDHCEHPAHRCVRTCHVYRRPSMGDADDEEGEEADGGDGEPEEDVHAYCPYPCPKTLACGHRCLASCGVACPPCAFEGWVELPCGQMVVSGMNGKEVQHTVFPHYQWVVCGGTPESCNSEVTLSCPRCGGKVRGPCTDAENSGDWPCSQCDAEAKKIRVEFGIREDNGGERDVAVAGEGDPIADTVWPQAATEKFEKQLAFLRQKSALLEKRLALEVAAKGVDRNPEHVAEEKRVHAIRAEQEENEQQWRQKSGDAKTEWAANVKQAVDDQRRWNDQSEVLHRQVIEALLH